MGHFLLKRKGFKKELLLSAFLAVGIVAMAAATSTSNTKTSRSGAAAVLNVAVMGDSTSDEYRAENNRGGSYGATTHNWLEQLTKYRNVNFGTWGSWGGFRRSGYEFNYSLSGATTTSGKAANAHVAVGQLAASGRVNVVFYELGANDFAWYNQEFKDIYSGALAGDRLATYITKVVTNVSESVAEIDKSKKAKIIISLIPDMTVSPSVQAKFPDATKRKRVSDAVSAANARIRQIAISGGHAIFDTESLSGSILSKVDAQGNLVIGGEKISLISPGDEPHHVLLADEIHPGTVYAGVYANAWIAVANTIMGSQIAPFSDNDLLINAGIRQATASPTTPTPLSTISPTPTATVRPSVMPSPTLTPKPTATPTVKPSPTASPRPTVSPTPKPTLTPVATATPRPTATPNPYAQYCGTYRSLRSVLVRFLSASQIQLWDMRCGI